MPNVDSRIVRVVLDHLRETFGSGVDEAFEDAGMHPGDLDGGAAWVSSTFLERFYENVAEQQTGDRQPQDMTHPFWRGFQGAGRTLISDQTPFAGMIRALVTPRTFYRALPRFMSTSSGVTKVEVQDEGDGRITITAFPDGPSERDLPAFCWTRRGAFEAIPSLWDRPLAVVTHPHCMHDPINPSETCVYHVSYETRRPTSLQPLIGILAGALMGLLLGPTAIGDINPLTLATLGAGIGFGCIGWWQYGRSQRARTLDAARFSREIADSEARYKDLEENQTAFRMLAENDAQVFWIGNPARNRLRYVSPAVQTVFGWPVEALKANQWTWRDAIVEEDRTRVEAAMEQLQRGAAEVSYRIRRRDGSLRHIHERLLPLRDPNGDLRQVAGVSADITDRLEAEHALRDSDERLRRAQKMEALGRLAGGVAHDFNNLLTVIQGSAQIAAQEVDPESSVGEDLQEIIHTVDRAAALTRRLLAFGRRQLLEMAPHDLSLVLEQNASLLNRLLPDDVQLVMNLDPNLPWVLSDEDQLSQVLMNLAVNARDAMPRGGRMEITTRPETVTSPIRHPMGDVPIGRYVMLQVKDNGTGMTDRVLANAFDPFFTTKAPDRGTGLGLATVHGIIEQHRGVILCTSTPDEGTSFNIYLPVTGRSRQVAHRHVTRPHPPALQSQQTVMVVEDEVPLRRLACRILRRAGYQVLEAESSEEAIHIATRALQPITALLTDVVMPGPSGREVAEAVRGAHPDAAIIYTSGHTDDELLRRGIAQNELVFLPKPYTPKNLLLKLNDVLAPVGGEWSEDETAGAEGCPPPSLRRRA